VIYSETDSVMAEEIQDDIWLLREVQGEAGDAEPTEHHHEEW
jgi:hypothetical protein